MTQIKRRAVQREGPMEIAHGHGREEGVKQERGISSNSCQHHSKAREASYKSCGQVAMDFHKTFSQVAEDTHKTSGQMTEHFHKTSGQVTKAPQESHGMSTPSSLKPLGHTKEALPRKIVGIKRPSEPLEHDKSKKVLKLESEPGPLEVTDQSCKDQPKVKKTVKPKATDKKGLKPALHKASEKRKGSHQVNTKGFLEPSLLRHAQEYDAFMPSGHRPGDLHKGKVPLPPGEKKLFSPAREADVKRKAMRSPEESPKKKREDKGDTPRKKKE
ncbi:AF4/FMR2 family member 1-like [Anomalospiza imberbis]|uniref:AF4/FMR2 family member 1-like n=1 Tax=Anomalospiza imberbis TaxID=187417 RepID=UPI00358E55FB